MVMDERTKVSQHHHHHHQQQRGGDDVGAGDLGLSEDMTNVEGTSSMEGSPPPSTNGTMVGDGPTNGPPVNVYLIGLEFVRQYYTVLHQGPLYLHRFYSEDSSFVHDDSKAVYGQENIRERIQDINFCNCVAKILQVDSHDTLGDGVVIQVRGELSNNGQPMRRFMQTFVLAPQSPKRFYVRNDIFHYQDEIIQKDEFKSMGAPSVDSLHIHNDADDEISDDEYGKAMNSSHTGGNINMGMNNLQGHRDEQKTIDAMRDLSLDGHVNEGQYGPPPTAIRRGSHGFMAGPPPQQQAQQRVVEEPKEIVVSAASPPPPAPAPVMPKDQKEQVQEMPKAVTPTPAPVTPTPDTAPAGPVAKTYANLFKSGPAAVATSVPVQSRANPPFPVKTVVTSGLSPASENEDVTSPPTNSPQPPNDQASASKNLPPVRGQFGTGYNRDRNFRERRNENRERLMSRSSTTGNDDSGSIDGDGRRSNINYPDSHQLFVGNLPHTVTPTEIKEIFGPYGKVAEVKILKPNQKNAGSKVPYFCFVVFEEASSADAALVEKTKITMKMGDGSNRRLNVEEKRPREMGEGRSFPQGGNMPTSFPRDSRENLNAPAGGSTGVGNNNMGGGNMGNPNQFRRGDNNGGNANRPPNPGGGPLSEHRNQPPRTRTFRGSNRGGGVGGVGGGGGGGPGAR